MTDWITIEDLENRYKQLEYDIINISVSYASADAIRKAMKDIKEELKSRGHHGFDFNQ